MKELFRPIPVEAMTRVPIRPLGKFSDFVVMDLPARLTAIREGAAKPSVLNEQSERLIEGLTSDVTTRTLLTPASADLALLDMLIMDNVLVRITEPNPKLTALIDSFAAANGRPPVITYEDLILINPLNTDCRINTEEEIGAVERDFYIAHREIEEDLDVVIDTSKVAIERLKQEGPNAVIDVAAIIHSAGLRWVEINAYMTLLGEVMSTEHFATFRPYFLEHPTRTRPDGRKYKGPSGAFTASIPVFEILFAGEKMKPEQFNYFRDNEIYFPRKGQRDIQEALGYLGDGLTLTQLASSLDNPPVLMEELAKLDHYLNQFRGKHYAGVRRQIPGAIEGNVSGSAGETDVGRFLRGRIIKHLD